MIYKSKQINNFTVLPNQIFQDTNNGLAIGILAYLLSKPDDWVTYKQQLYTHFTEGRQRIDKAFSELEQLGYIVGIQQIGSDGKFTGYQWIVYNVPVTTENRLTENRQSENEQLLNKEYTKEINTKVSNTQRFVIPTVEEIQAYCLERDNGVDAQRFFDFYSSKGWLVGKSKMKDWKASVRTWERDSPKKQNTLPPLDRLVAHIALQSGGNELQKQLDKGYTLEQIKQYAS